MRLALAALCALLLLPAPAGAHVPGLDRYMQVAEQAFPDVCEPLTVTQLHEVDGETTLAWFQPWDCTIAFPARRVHRWAPELACQVTVHERGHAAGYRDPVGVERPDGTVDHHHSPDPRNVMHPWIGTHVYAPCRRFQRWHGARAARRRPVLIDHGPRS